MSYVLLDLRPNKMDELSEVITSATFHDTETSLMMYSTTKGNVKICDLRQSHDVNEPVLVFESENLLDCESYYHELLLSCLDA